jgi:type VI secretion system secreted protein VgrG
VTSRKIEVELSLPLAATLRVASLRVTEGMSEHCEAEVEVSTNEDVDFQPALTQPATVRLIVEGAVRRQWSLATSSAVFLGITSGTRRYRISLRDALWFSRFVKNTRKFRNTTGKDIAAKILAEGRVAASWALTRETWERKYCVQYRETNLDFVLRLLEFEGIYHTFDENGVLLLADRSQASPPVDGASYFELLDGAGALAQGQEGIHAFRKGARIAPGKATVHDFNWKKPSLDLRASAEAEVFSELEVYHSPTGYREAAEGAFLAQIRLEALRAGASFVEGRGSVASFAPARVFTFGPAAGDDFSGEWLLTRVEHTFVDPRFSTDTRTAGPSAPSYENAFRAIPRDVPFRPPLRTPRPTVAGVHTAMVRGPVGEEIHTEKHGRFKAQFHWDREAKGTDEDSRWVRMLQEPSTSITLARVGWEMSVGYIDGDPERPIGLARNINGVMLPTYAQPGNQSRMTIRTQSYPGGGGYNELRLEDSAGAMHFDIRAERDYVGVVKRNRVERIGNDHVQTCKAKLGRGVGRDQTLFIGGDSVTSCTGTLGLAVADDRTKTVDGNERIEAGRSVIEDVSSDDEEKVGADRTTTADRGIVRVVEEKLTRKFDADHTILAKGPIQLRTGRFTEIVGGSKSTTASGAGIQQAVTGALTVTVDGSVTRVAGDSVTTSAKSSVVTIEGSATLGAGKRVELVGKVVELEAKSRISLSAANLSITLTPGCAAMTGNVKLDAGTTITVTGTPDEITS